MIKTIEQMREYLNRVINYLDAISFRESIQYKDYILLRKVQKSIFKLSFAIITTEKGVIIC